VSNQGPLAGMYVRISSPVKVKSRSSVVPLSHDRMTFYCYCSYVELERLLPPSSSQMIRTEREQPLLCTVIMIMGENLHDQQTCCLRVPSVVSTLCVHDIDSESAPSVCAPFCGPHQMERHACSHKIVYLPFQWRAACTSIGFATESGSKFRCADGAVGCERDRAHVGGENA
jgi:hypothetical protein